MPIVRSRPPATPPSAPAPVAPRPTGRRAAAAPRLPHVSVRRLALRFALTGLVGMVVLASVTAVASRRVGTDQAIDEASRVGVIAGHGIVEPALTPGVLRGDPQALAAFDRRVRDDLLQGSLVRVKLWDATGRIVYSDEQRLIGQRFALDDEALAALEGEPTRGHVSNLSSSENRFEPTGSGLLEVYSRIEGPGGEPLLFEPYFSFSAVTESGRRIWLAFAPVVLGALLVLQLMQFPLAWSMARRLRRGQQERERLLRHAIDASDRERRRIAGDLHDGTVQDLAGVSLALAAAGRRARGAGAGHESAAEVLDDAAGRVRGAITSMRSLLVDIYPPNLLAEGLDQSLSDLLARLSVHGITPTVDVVLPQEGLPEETTTLLYRCAQEAVRNVVRHARARRIWLTLRPSGDLMILEISDDGAGFDPRDLTEARAEGHLGLRALADLVAEAGGSVDLASAPGRGTRIRMEVPR